MYTCILYHKQPISKEHNDDAKKSLELFRKAYTWYDAGMDINEATDLYEQSALLGNSAANNNFFIIMDAMSTNQNITNDRYKKMQLFDPEKYFIQHGPNKLTEMVLMRIYINNPKMFHRVFMENKEIYERYEEHIKKNKIYALVLGDLNNNLDLTVNHK